MSKRADRLEFRAKLARAAEAMEAATKALERTAAKDDSAATLAAATLCTTRLNDLIRACHVEFPGE